MVTEIILRTEAELERKSNT